MINVVLSFDIDAETLWTSRDKENKIGPVMLSQGAYGPKEGIPRILDLLNKRELSATFFITGWVIEHYRSRCEDIVSAGHEVGHHNYNHEWPWRVNADVEKEAFDREMVILKDLLGRTPSGYRAPGWEFSDVTMDLLLNSEIKYSSNFMDSDVPYRHIYKGNKTNLVELPVSWMLDDAAFFMHGLTYGPPQFNPETVLSMWKAEFDALYKEERDTCFILTMHPQIMGRPARMAMLDKLVEYIRKKEGVRFITAEALAEEYRGL
ncbi:MAG: polysaccharide deacetylase [Spirochaetales bacterium]|nr:polysaccharide deacetylase [Spirochaetales bacterium]